MFAGKPLAPTNLTIVLAKMKLGQGVNVDLHVVKGIGKNHVLLVRLIAFLYYSNPLLTVD